MEADEKSWTREDKLRIVDERDGEGRAGSHSMQMGVCIEMKEDY